MMEHHVSLKGARSWSTSLAVPTSWAAMIKQLLLARRQLSTDLPTRHLRSHWAHCEHWSKMGPTSWWVVPCFPETKQLLNPRVLSDTQQQWQHLLRSSEPSEQSPFLPKRESIVSSTIKKWHGDIPPRSSFKQQLHQYMIVKLLNSVHVRAQNLCSVAPLKGSSWCMVNCALAAAEVKKSKLSHFYQRNFSGWLRLR